MRQSLSSFEEAFHEELDHDRERREALRREAAARSRARLREREQQRSTLRFVALTATLLGTAVAVTLFMFQALLWVMG
jgi:uncharacterized membrane protein